MRFFLNREKIASRKDRADPFWATKLEYDPDLSKVKLRTNRTIDFDQ